MRNGGRNRQHERSDHAAVGVLAVLLMVVATTLGAMGLYAWIHHMQATGSAPPALSLVVEPGGCRHRIVVAGAPEPVALAELVIRPGPGEGATLIALDGRAAVDGVWEGGAGERRLGVGDEFHLWSEKGRSFFVVHVPSQTTIGRIGALPGNPDGAPPEVTFEPPSDPAGLPNVAGAARDECSGVARVALAIHDATSGLAWDGAGWSAAARELPATLASPGARATAWTLPLGEIAWEPGHAYTFTVRATDAAGNG